MREPQADLRMNPYALLAIVAACVLAVASNLLYWLPPDDLIVSPWAAVLGTLAGAFSIAAGWCNRHN